MLRAKLGTSVQVLDGKGGLYQTQLVQALPKAAELAVLSRVNCERPSLDLNLVIGVLKPKAMDQVLKRAVEIGVTRIYPVLTEYGSFSLDAHQSLMKASKWRTALIEACKQSGNVFLPELMHTATLKSFLEEILLLCSTLLLLIALSTMHTNRTRSTTSSYHIRGDKV